MIPTFWNISQCPFRKTPSLSGVRILDIPPRTVLEGTGNISRQDILWIEITYLGKTGWVYSGYLEPFQSIYPQEVLIENQTPSPYDAQQYITINGKTKYNMCGELCIAFLHKTSLGYVLQEWEKFYPKDVLSIWKNNVDRGTGLSTLEKLSSLLSPPSENLYPNLSSVLKDPVLKRPIFTPSRLKSILSSHAIIIGVKINKYTGRLLPAGILHWVVLTKVEINGIEKGFVEIYNPFPNTKEIYSWREFSSSAGVPYGICIPLSSLPKEDPIPPLTQNEK